MQYPETIEITQVKFKNYQWIFWVGEDILEIAVVGD